ncbi:DUF3604 domain-containing protein [Haliea sp. E17]|uniref:DUF3604 domain-containing protein n=1 Tax=Haliea sp. E17 TaxID=3401576 RepID=UPI003AAD1DF3
MNNSSRGLAYLPFIVIPLLAAGCQKSEPPPAVTAAPEPAAEAVAVAPAPEPAVPAYPVTAWFGDTHVHTGWSADAGMDGAITTPEDAYRFARGEVVKSNTGLDAQISKPYDWFLVSDHSDGMGTINQIIDGNPEMLANPIIKGWSEALNSGDEARAAAAKSELIIMQSEERLPPEVTDPKWMKTAWEKTVEAAEKYYQPGEFTTFIAYEWTVNADGGNNLHRNVIFRDGADRGLQVLPLTTFQTQDPADLWAWMAAYEEKTGGRMLAIPHNGNMSNGRMFEEQQFDGSPMTREWAEQRQRYERSYELTQYKGQSESHPALSPEDEFSDWDLWDRGNLIMVSKPEGALKYEYWREALKSGMRIRNELGVNPFTLGAVAGTDTHTGLSSVEEDNFFGKFKTLEPSNKERWNFPLISGKDGNYMGWEMSASGVTGVWSVANTREAIWDAMERRETFATTGSRMSLRFFGSFGFTDETLAGDWVATGYDQGVPMGGMLSTAPEGYSPTFIVAASKDPDGANLDRIQVVKGWVDADNAAHEKIYDVIWSDERAVGDDGRLPPVGNTVNMETGEYDNSIGAQQLLGVFTDPDFDPALQAVYYVRVLEIPTPRWTLFDKLRNGTEMDPEVPLVQQERGFSSPIWYTP